VAAGRAEVAGIAGAMGGGRSQDSSSSTEVGRGSSTEVIMGDDHGSAVAEMQQSDSREFTLEVLDCIQWNAERSLLDADC